MTLAAAHHALRSVAHFHDNPKLIGWLQERRAIVYLTAERRRRILFYGALVAGAVALIGRTGKAKALSDGAKWLVPLIDFPLLLGLLYLVYLAALRLPRLPALLRRSPQLFLHLVFWALLIILWWTPAEASLWRSALVLFALSMPYLLWRCGYLLLSAQRCKVAATRFGDHLIYLWPLWGGTLTPYGKGLEYLSKYEAKTAEVFARSVLAGVKLALLGLLWIVVEKLFNAAIYNEAKWAFLTPLAWHGLGVPRLSAIVNGSAPASLWITWVSLYCELIRDVIDIAGDGHGFVALLRIFGFNVFRNTYKPLFAESIIDFWSRYYYYFKELMFEIFFSPTYLNYFRRHPRLRMLAALFAAAFLGNTYYHVVQSRNSLVAGEFAALDHVLGPRLVYCLFLTVGIYFSMLRQQRRGDDQENISPGQARLRRIGRIAWVWTFFGFLTFWSLKTDVGLLAKARFFISFFGV